MRMTASIARWAALLTFLGGCACCCGNWPPIGPSPDIEPADIVGVWASDEGARLTLNADMTFKTENLEACERPDSLGVDSDGGTGTWTLDGPHRLDPYQDLTLKYAPYDEAIESWRAADDEIVFLYGDTDNGEICFFERAD
ncbi:MAG: hypothetical protein HOU81_25430 [Hamadaea sp.]|uniref:hypothetical protein n=1 Tax=Hamadaea sp. TaxID=2024425 RepID=UPI0017EAB108|nr:hypothetical protein [Hamadaea sp.]NUR74165.1 hypothetical protein [Hamadaea sp.]NUT21314.1 hypothetical protein [Hamadaea sp.]